MASKPTSTKTARKAGDRPAGGRAAKAKLVQSSSDDAGAPAAGADETGKTGAGLRLKDLVDRVVAATGGKKAGVKEIVEATLVQMGEALQKGETMNLPAFGKMRVARQGADGGAMTLKLRQGDGKGKGKGKAEKEALADAEDQD